MKHILGSCVLAGLFLFCACDDTLDTKVTWQIGDSDTWRVPELAQGVLYKAYNGIANRIVLKITFWIVLPIMQ